VPGVVAGLALVHHKYGKLPWADVIAPAIALARDGSTLDSFHADDMKSVLERIGEYAKDPQQQESRAADRLEEHVRDLQQA
jgi:gamma-glutamyltranspeptidase